MSYTSIAPTLGCTVCDSTISRPGSREDYRTSLQSEKRLIHNPYEIDPTVRSCWSFEVLELILAEMAFVELAPELVHQIYNTLYSINDVINLSLTCRHFNVLLKHSQKLPTLFAAAEREFGPLEDVAQLVTFNASQPAHIKRHPQQNYALLRQMIKIGGVAQKCADIFPERRWQDNYLERRTLSNDEVWRLRRAVYRYWLYCEAFQGRGNLRSMRMLPYMVEERAQLLRTWTTGKPGFSRRVA